MDVSAHIPRPVILLAEDEAELRMVVLRILEKSGYAVLPAADGVEAIAIAEQHTNDIRLLMSDVRMPGLHGDELARQLQARMPDLKVILMSGTHGDGAGVQDGWMLLPKPFHPGVLLSAVRDALDPA